MHQMSTKYLAIRTELRNEPVMVLLGRLHLDIFRHSLMISSYIHFPDLNNCTFGLTFRARCRYFESARPKAAKLRSACDVANQRTQNSDGRGT
jgi:hypothetical protein